MRIDPQHTASCKQGQENWAEGHHKVPLLKTQNMRKTLENENI